MNTTISLEKTTQFTQLNLGTAELNPNYMAKSNQKTRKTKEDYIDELNVLVFEKAKKLTIKQIRTLIAKHA